MNVAFLRKHATSLLLCAAALGGGIYMVADKGSQTSDEATRRKGNLFLAWRQDDISRVTVQLPEGSYELTRSEGPAGRSWQIEIDGQTLSAEDQMVDRLLGTLEYASFARQLSEGAAKDTDAGLDPPQLSIEIAMGKITHRLRIGKPIATDEGYYAEVLGRGVFVVNKALLAALSVSPSELRSRDFVPYLSADLAKVTLTTERGELVVERAPWSGGRGSGFRFAATTGANGPLSEMAGKRVDASPLDQVWVAFGRMQAQTFLKPDVAKASSVPQVTITLQPKEGPISQLRIGGACPDKPGLIVATRDQPSAMAVCVPEGILPALTKEPSEFIDDGVLGSTEDEISELRIEREGKVLDFARAGTGFHLRKPDDREIDLEAGNSFLEGLVAAKGKLTEQRSFDPKQPTTKVRVVSVGGLTQNGETAERVEEVEIGKSTEGDWIAQRKEDGAVLIVGEVSASAFSTNDLVLREPTVLSLSADDVMSVSIETLKGRQKVARKGADFELLLPKGVGLEADAALSQELIASVAKLRAERWVTAAPAESQGLAEPRAKLSIVVKNPDDSERTLSLLIGERTDDGAYAKLADKPEVFVVSRRFDETAQRYLVSRAGFFVPTEVMSEVVFESKERKVRLVRDGRQLKLESAESAVRSSAIQAALSALMPVEVTSVGAQPAAKEGFATPILNMQVGFRKLPDDPTDAPTRAELIIGAPDTLRGAPIYYARKKGIDATYALPREPVQTLLSLFGENP